MTHLIEDESIGGLLREYVETDRMAIVGDYVSYVRKGVRDAVNVKVEEVDLSPDEPSYTDIEEYTTLDSTDIIHVDGVRYKLVDRKAEVGEKVVIVNTLFDYGDAGTIGDVFTVEAVTNDCCYGDEEYLNGISVIESDVVFLEREFRVLVPADIAEIYIDGKKVAETPLHSEAIEVDESQASPDVIDMLTNLSRRIVRLEDEIDTLHSNQKRMAEELANLSAGSISEQESAEVIVELAKLLVERVREGGR